MSSSYQHGVLVAFTAGATSGVITTVAFQPLDLVKTRMQATLLYDLRSTQAARTLPAAQRRMLDVFVDIVRREKFLSLWNGVIPSIQRCVPGIGMYFATIHFLRTMVGSKNGNVTASQALVIGGISRTISTASVLPFTVVKARYESGHYQYQGVGHALSSIWKHEGRKGLYSGMLATLVRDAPFSAIYLMFYSQSKQALEKSLGQSFLPPRTILLCSIFSGAMASIVTQPADVIKTHMQLKPEVHANIRSTIAGILKSHGAKGLFTGLVPRVTRRTLMAAFTWTFYEQLVTLIVRYTS